MARETRADWGYMPVVDQKVDVDVAPPTRALRPRSPKAIDALCLVSQHDPDARATSTADPGPQAGGTRLVIGAESDDARGRPGSTSRASQGFREALGWPLRRCARDPGELSPELPRAFAFDGLRRELGPPRRLPPPSGAAASRRDPSCAPVSGSEAAFLPIFLGELQSMPTVDGSEDRSFSFGVDTDAFDGENVNDSDWARRRVGVLHRLRSFP